jgi:SAM-dependent methyltransferase
MRARVARDAAASASAVCASTAHASDPLASAESSAARSAPADRIAAGSEPAFGRLVARAAARFRPAGRGPYYFARGKLGGDPVFAALLRDGRIASDARIVDIGCGLGILAALLAAAEQCDPRSASEWPQTWAPPPRGWTLRGFDLRTDAIAAGQRGLFDVSDRVLLSVGDVREVTLPECDIVVMLDVLHYVDPVAQRTLLTNAYSALASGGTLLLRVGDAAPNWRFRFTAAVDWWVKFAREGSRPQLQWRSLAEWTSLLEAIGFSIAAQPMSEGTLFANVLLIATKPTPPER